MAAHYIPEGYHTVTPYMVVEDVDRLASVKAPWGNFWTIATHQETVSPEELAQRARENMR